jgi:predicted aspartyl protease
MKSNTSPTPLAKLEYDFLEDLKKTKSNISLFELMKIPQIQENFIRTLQCKTSPRFCESNSRTKRVITKVTSPNNNTPSKIQVATNASLTCQRSRSNTPPFLITFEVFNRNVHNFMVDLGASSNVMPLKVCEKLKIKPELSNIQIIQLDIR